ncbi:ABC transporter ATP-binding protein [Dietzia sp.]|uniref:ABC transporter ATP-binding protein n=1 Tax=Dietzia sp. TaxID=1871616 RepID=UPI002FD9DF8E
MSARAVPLAARDLRVDRGGRTILDGVGIDVPAGSTLAVVGTNGSGKSTLLRALVGITPAAAGEIEIDGHAAAGGRAASRRWARMRARTMSFVGQEELPTAELSVAEAVSLGRTPHRKPWAGHDPGEHEAVARAMEAVGIADLAGTSCSRLSGGQRHRVVIARALAQETPLLLLDEPTNHLDPVWRLRLLEALRRSGRTVVLALHELDMVMQYADLVAVLDGGTLRAHGRPADVLGPELVREVFGVESAVVRRPGDESRGAGSSEHLLTWHDDSADPAIAAEPGAPAIPTEDGAPGVPAEPSPVPTEERQP